MNNYTTNNKFIANAFINCTPFHRCNDYKICPTCFKIWKKRQFKKATQNLTEKRIRDFKYKYFLTFVSLDTKISIYEKNSNIDLFLDTLIKSKRAKISLLNNTEYFTVKHLSKDEHYGINPHLHMIFFSNKIFKRDKKLKELLSRFNLRIDCKEIKKHIDNSYKTSVLKLLNYCLKYNPDTLEIEHKYKLTHNKSYIKKSSLFCKRKFTKKHKNLCTYIHEYKALINAFYTSKLKEAKKVLKSVKRSNSKQYIKAIKSYTKKAHNISRARLYYINSLKTLNIYNFLDRVIPRHLRHLKTL